MALRRGGRSRVSTRKYRLRKAKKKRPEVTPAPRGSNYRRNVVRYQSPHRSLESSVREKEFKRELSEETLLEMGWRKLGR